MWVSRFQAGEKYHPYMNDSSRNMHKLYNRKMYVCKALRHVAPEMFCTIHYPALRINRWTRETPHEMYLWHTET